MFVYSATPPAPRSSLFPYTTLFRSQQIAGLAARFAPDAEAEQITAWAHAVSGAGEQLGLGVRRSEEHTSELQSLTNLVCRLLLEKKNKRIKTQTRRNRNTSTI